MPARKPTRADIYPTLYRLEHYALDVFKAHGRVLSSAAMTARPMVVSVKHRQTLVRVADPRLIARLARTIKIDSDAQLNVAKIIGRALPRLWKETSLPKPSWWFAAAFATLGALVPDEGTNKVVGRAFMGDGGGSGGRPKRETAGLTTYLGTVMEELKASGKKPTVPNILTFIAARQKENGGEPIGTGISACPHLRVAAKRLSWLQDDGTWSKSLSAKTLYRYLPKGQR